MVDAMDVLALEGLEMLSELLIVGSVSTSWKLTSLD